MISEGLRKNAFWLYGVIVGLAIKHALETVIGHMLDPSVHIYLQPGVTLTKRLAYLDGGTEVVRLAVFLFTIIQFYLGSVWFFDKFYEGESVAYENNEYATDFLFGLAHFLFFFGWALSINTHSGYLRVFPILAIIILLYDSVWCRACKGRGNQQRYFEIRKWTLVNVGVVGLAVLTYLLAIHIAKNYFDVQRSPIRHRIGEVAASVPILAFSVVDIVGMIIGKQIIADLVIKAAKGVYEWIARRLRGEGPDGPQPPQG
ncbi:MAG TPA: hypothetical protein VJ875_06370 [Pyrinomonadaceae bacterium]|nr:hypothetical protein [Pyrinomonadaceae bacterium]